MRDDQALDDATAAISGAGRGMHRGGRVGVALDERRRRETSCDAGGGDYLRMARCDTTGAGRCAAGSERRGATSKNCWGAGAHGGATTAPGFFAPGSHAPGEPKPGAARLRHWQDARQRGEAGRARLLFSDPYRPSNSAIPSWWHCEGWQAEYGSTKRRWDRCCA